MEELARRASVSLQSVANWEAYRNVPSLRNYADLAIALGVRVSDVQDIVRQMETEILRRGDRVA